MSGEEPGRVRPALQRVVVHVQTSTAPAGEPLPWAVLRHGETPALAAGRALGAAVPADVRALLDVADAARWVPPEQTPGLDDGVDLHTVHLVLAADAAAAEGPVQGALVPDAEIGVEAGELDRLRPGAGAGRAVVRQRLAAYAVIVSDDDRLLLTRLSTRTPSPGRWTLPGGGVDHGEHPVTAAVREVYEETGMRVGDVTLADVGAEHFTGRSPKGVLEDFHAVRILVTATAEHVLTPEVLDVGGSTDEARWVPIDEAATLGLVGVAHRGLAIAQRHQRAGKS